MNKRHYEHTLPNIRGSLSNTYDENKKLNILKDRKLDRQEKNKSEGLKKGKGATLCSNLC